MKTVLFYLNVIVGMPLLSVVTFVINLVKAIQRAVRFTNAECSSAYRSNARRYGR